MFGFHLADGGPSAALAVIGLASLVFFAGFGASETLRSLRRRRFRVASGRAYRMQSLDLADPMQQLKAVMAATFDKQKVLSRAEYRAFKIVEDEVAAMRKGYRVFAQTSLGEILKSSDRNAFHSINSKRADILVVDQGGWPVLVVEYQGDGHYQSMAAARDAVKKEALRKAGVRHLEFHPADRDDEFRSRVRGQLGWKPAPAGRSFTLSASSTSVSLSTPVSS